MGWVRAPPGSEVRLGSATTGFGRSVRIFLADSQGFHRFMATDLEHEDVVDTAVVGPENNMIITGSRDALIQVRAWTLTSEHQIPNAS